MNVLIMDDDPSTRLLLRNYLQVSEFKPVQIIEAEHGQQGLEVLQSNPIDLILSDISMPVMNGIDFFEKVRNHPVFKDIPAVVISAEKSSRIKTMLKFWSVGFVPKPFRLQALRDEISTKLRKSHDYVVFG